jgi:ElaB/YqjD/DUF883 family membrane-anchored ribosome-binding protein
MAQDQKPGEFKPDYDALLAQIEAMRLDMAKIALQMADTVTAQGAAVAQTVSDGLTDAGNYAARKGQAVDARIEHAVAANPYVALGIAAALGLLLGALARK